MKNEVVVSELLHSEFPLGYIRQYYVIEHNHMPGLRFFGLYRGRTMVTKKMQEASCCSLGAHILQLRISHQVRNYPPPAPPAEILVSTSGFGPGGVSGPYRILKSFLRKPSLTGATSSQETDSWSAHALPGKESG